MPDQQQPAKEEDDGIDWAQEQQAWLDEEADRQDQVAALVRSRGIALPVMGEDYEPPPLNPDGSLAQEKKATGKKPATAPAPANRQAKRLPSPPRPGLVFSETSHRWERPEHPGPADKLPRGGTTPGHGDHVADTGGVRSGYPIGVPTGNPRDAPITGRGAEDTHRVDMGGVTATDVQPEGKKPKEPDKPEDKAGITTPGGNPKRKLGEYIVNKRRDIGEGTTGAEFVWFEGDGRGIEKMAEREGHDDSSFYEQMWPQGFWLREVATSDVADLFNKAGMHMPVPNTVQTEDEDGNQGARQDFFKGMEMGGVDEATAREIAERPEIANYALFDFLSGNLDRHEGNWMVNDDGEIGLIDNGRAWPAENSRPGRHDPIVLAALMNHKVPKIPVSWHAIENALSSAGIPGECIESAEGRYDLLKKFEGKTFQRLLVECQLVDHWDKRGFLIAAQQNGSEVARFFGLDYKKIAAAAAPLSSGFAPTSSPSSNPF
jgi:hypothetical protein